MDVKNQIIKIMIALFLVIMLLQFTGCGGKNSQKKTEPVPSESNRWLNLLKVLPENEDTLSGAYLSDGEYMLEKIPSSQYPIGLSIPLFGDCPGGCYDEEWKATLGFVSSDVHQVVYAGTLPMNIYQAARGDFNADEINIAARTGPGNEDVIIQSHAGYEYYSWGEDRAVNLTRRSHVRPLGRGHRLALVDDYVFWMLWTEGIEDMIGAYTDTIPSLDRKSVV
jgi:hypothetical protein